MIKCLWYWKLLKLSFFGLLTSFFTIFVGSSVNASWQSSYIWLDSTVSEVNSSFKYTFLKWWAVLSELLWYSRSVLALDNWVLFWWTPNWLPYFYLEWGAWIPTAQGFFDRYFVCDVLTWWLPQNCNLWWNISLTWDNQVLFSVFKNFFQQVNRDDLALYQYEKYSFDWSSWWKVNYINVCFSSQSIWNSICFNWWICDSNSNRYCTSVRGAWTSSQNYENLTFSNLSSNSIWYAPWQVWYLGGWNIDGWSEVVESAPITWDVMLKTCTKSRALDWYIRNWYNQNMCYSSYWNNIDIFSGAWSVHDFSYTWTYIRSVWQDTNTYRREWQIWSSMDYLTWFKYWRNTYEIYQNRSDSLDNPFVGVPVSLFMLFGNITQYWRPYESDSILDFCTLLTYSDLDTPYSWFYSSQICSQSALDMVADIYWIHASGWQLVAWSSWVWITNRVPISWDVLFSWWEMQDSLSFQNNIFNLLKSVFRYPDENWNRFLPEFLVIWFIWIVFFRLIRKRF